MSETPLSRSADAASAPPLLATRLRRWVRGDGRQNGPWIMWLGWRYRGHFAYDPCHGSGYHHLSFKFFYVDWVSA